MNDLSEKKCTPCEISMTPVALTEARVCLEQLPGWELELAGLAIAKVFVFKDFHHTMAFVNAVAWVAHQEGHHPDLEVGYNRCKVRYSTHAVNGLTQNDFVCAAKIEALLR